jgi:hypothetical protein
MEQEESRKKALFFSYFTAAEKWSTHWSVDVKSAADIPNTSKDGLVTFLKMNISKEDFQELDLSSMSKVDLRRHAIAAALAPNSLTLDLLDCLTPYAECSSEELLRILRVRGTSMATFEKTPTRLELLRMVMFGSHFPLHIDVAGEEVRRKATEKCLTAISTTFLEARVEEETKRFLDWTRRDGRAHNDPVLLMDRVVWLAQLPSYCNRAANKAIRYVSRHVLPFIEWRKDLIIWQHGCWEALKVDRKLERAAVASLTIRFPFQETSSSITTTTSDSSSLGRFFFDVPFPDLSTLRVPQKIAILKLQEEHCKSEIISSSTAAEHGNKNEEDKYYYLLMRLRSWFSRMLRASYVAGEPLPWNDGDDICTQMSNLSRAKLSPCPLMVVLPTGVGKSGVMCVAPFVLERKPRRVLVVCPTCEIRDQNAKGFLTFYQRRLNLTSHPHVVSIAGDFDAATFANFDVFVTTFHQFIGNSMVAKYPRDYFDLILVDEAHHAEAATYRLLREHFVMVPFFYFTGTPYRSNHEALRAVIVYSCTMKEALKPPSPESPHSPYIKHVCYCPLPVTSLTLRSELKELVIDGFDEVVANAGEIWPALRWAELSKVHVIGHALEKLRFLRAISGIHHQAILQASDSEEAHGLVKLWRCHPDNYCGEKKETFTIDIVESDLGKDHNASVIKKLQADELDAIVHIGMIGEGFDCPHLSVCCIFRRFGSMSPYMQLVGRVVRRIEGASDKDNIAYVIAHPGHGLHQHWKLYNLEDEIPDANELSLSSPSSHWTDVLAEEIENNTTDQEQWFSRV